MTSDLSPDTAHVLTHDKNVSLQAFNTKSFTKDLNHALRYINYWARPYSWKTLVLRVAPSNKMLRKFLEMWAFPLKIKEKILVKKKVIQKAS